MPRPPRPSSPLGAAAPAVDGSVVWWWIVVFAATLLIYAPTLSAGFIWDDVGHVTRADLRPLGGLARIWFEIGATQQYYPLLHSAFWLEHRLWGDSAVAYHLLNVLLHATGACLFGLLLRRLAVPGAWLAALLFALHPVCVESVAWISEQKNTLSTVLYLAAALAYLRFDSHRRPAHYVIATGLFLLALLTKTVTATLPAALLVVFWWQRGRIAWRREVLPLLPWFVLGAASGLLTAHVERTLIGAEGTNFALNALERGLLAGRVVWFYLGKLVWPADLIFIYPRWTVDAAVVEQWLFPLGGLALLCLCFAWRHRSRAPLAALLLFGGALFPVLGFVNVYPFLFSYVADHFQYLACLPILALVAAGLKRGCARLPRWAGLAGPSALLLLFAALSFGRSGVYRNKFALYEDTLARNPAAWMAHTNLAAELAGAGRLAEALPHLEEALKLHPNYAQGRANLGDALVQRGCPLEALPHLEEALRLQPDYAEAHNSLGTALVALGREAEGVAHYEEALRLNPALAVAQRNLGLAIAASGRDADAIPHFARAAALDPQDAQAELCWGIALIATRRPAEALPHLARAVELAPDSIEPLLGYGRTLASLDRMSEAAGQFRAAVDLAPDSGEAHLLLAYALRALGQPAEAQEHFRAAQRLGAAPR